MEQGKDNHYDNIVLDIAQKLINRKYPQEEIEAIKTDKKLSESQRE